eukprot:gnl/Spiro4/4548_TR2267_c0_g1_i1.p1 gnl/Spiro4/4548_TR2267_c0_g1~~gnl/Spiro4/4548_TR2267_c0_g1_i1.p1  ORF type:complete len:299 (+),score=68.80 gnl/Spiro4/4548_TR2267_c0_g1_i1:68-964(+)
MEKEKRGGRQHVTDLRESLWRNWKSARERDRAPNAPPREDAAIVNQYFNRVVYISRLSDRVQQQSQSLQQHHISAWHERLFAEAMGKDAKRPHTSGICLIFPSCLLHVLEGPEDLVSHFLFLLETEQQLEDPIVIGTTILLFSEDCNAGVRQFPGWFCRSLPSAAPEVDLVTVDPSSAVTHAAAVVGQMLDLGHSLCSFRQKQEQTSEQNQKLQSELATAVENLQSNYQHFLPTNQLLMGLYEQQRTNALFSLQNYLDLYQRPFDIQFEGDHTYPPDSGLSYLGSSLINKLTNETRAR